MCVCVFASTQQQSYVIQKKYQIRNKMFITLFYVVYTINRGKCVYIYIYIYIYVFIYINIYIYLSLHLYINISERDIW